MTIDDVLADGALPAMAILRGVTPDECAAVGRALIDAGIRLIEVPLNSPQPLQSIARMVDEFASEAGIGAGTVTGVAELRGVIDTGASFAVAPNCDLAVINAAVEAGFEFLPGIMTPSEAISAARAGSRRLKLFPASSMGPGHAKALSAVIDPDIRIWAVGGVDAGNAAQWIDAGCEGVAAGSNIYAPGKGLEDVSETARKFVDALPGLSDRQR